MCQIIALQTTVEKFKTLAKDRLYVSILNNILDDKGGDYFSLCVSINNSNLILSNPMDAAPLFSEALKIFKNMDIEDQEMSILLFSRQQPEMENSTVEEQPYLHNIEGGTFFAVHGTIHNDQELSKKYNAEIRADTEILKSIPISNWSEAEGTFCILGLKDNRVFKYEHGLKIWSNRIISSGEYLGDIFATTDLTIFDPVVIDIPQDTEERILFASFSGGMDIALSTYDQLKKGNYKKAVLYYFAWGSIAEKEEITTLEKFKDFYSSEFNIPIEIEILEAQQYFDEYFKLNKAPIPKISKNSPFYTGEIKETESPIAYVPYRNSQFALLLASRAEALNLKNVDFLFGLNLSEGMVYMDNSEGWLDTINKTVIYGGKDYQLSGTYNVVSPYFQKTKSNMLKSFSILHGIATLEQLLLLSKSCYYPNKDGSPCGQCGSCILRQKAIQNIKES